MLEIVGEKQAQKEWDKLVLLMDNYTFYQSYAYSLIQKKELLGIEFIYNKDNHSKINIMAYINICKDKVSIPFGPLTNNNVSIEEILNFIDQIHKRYHKQVSFSLVNDNISLLDEKNYDLKKGWFFATPLIDTRRPMDDVFNSFNENRKRIIKKCLLSIYEKEIDVNEKYAEEFYNLYKRRLFETNGEIDFSLDYLNNLLNSPNAKLTVCRKDNKVISGIVSFKFGNTVISRYNGFDSSYANISPTARLDYELIKQATEDCMVEYYDMSGIALEENATPKNLSVNQYKNSYRPSKILQYQRYKYK